MSHCEFSKAQFLSKAACAFFCFYAAAAHAAPEASPSPEPVKTLSKPVLVATSVSAPGAHSPEELIAGKTFEARPDAHFVKASFAFDPPVLASKIVIESCSADLRDGVEFFIFPGSRRIYAEGGGRTVVASLEKAFVDEPVEVRSLSINFRHNDNVCVKSLKFRDAADSVVEISSTASSAAPTGQNSGLASGLTSSLTSGEAKLPEKAPEKPAERSAESESRKTQFNNAGLNDVLDQELTVSGEDSKWVFRFRSDGTFFLFGSADDAKSAGRFTALGEYDVAPEGSKNKLKINLKGRKLVTPGPWDGWLCGKPCGERELARLSSIQETVILEKLAKGGFMIRNRAMVQRRSLPFSDLRLRKSIP